MVYISAFARIKSLIDTQGEGLGRGIHFLRFGLVLFSCFTFGREICYQNIYSIGDMMCELVTLSYDHFAFPPAPSQSFSPVPQSHPGEILWICHW